MPEPRVFLSGVKAIPQAAYGFVPRVIPWEVVEVGNGQLGFNIQAAFSVLHGYPLIDGSVSFQPDSSDLDDGPVPSLAVAVVYEGEVLEQFVLKEIVTEEDWEWLEQTHGVTKSILGIS